MCNYVARNDLLHQYLTNDSRLKSWGSFFLSKNTKIPVKVNGQGQIIIIIITEIFRVA